MGVGMSDGNFNETISKSKFIDTNPITIQTGISAQISIDVNDDILGAIVEKITAKNNTDPHSMSHNNFDTNISEWIGAVKAKYETEAATATTTLEDAAATLTDKTKIDANPSSKI